MRCILAAAIIVLASTSLIGGEARTYGRQEHLSPKARELTRDLAALRSKPQDPAVQETYLRAFPHTYKEFLSLFDVGNELYDGHDFIDPLPSLGRHHPVELGQLLVGLSKDAHYEADAPSYLQKATATYAAQHSQTFAKLLKELPKRNSSS